MKMQPLFFKAVEMLRDPFTQASFMLFVRILNAWMLSPRRRYITELIISSKSTQLRHFSCFHRFFSEYAWKEEELSKAHAEQQIQHFAPHDETIDLSGDDTLCRKRGLTVYGVGMHHDPLLSSKSHVVTSWGHDWVIICLIVRKRPWASNKVWAVPLCWRLYRNLQGVTKGKKKRSAKKSSKTKKPAGHRTRPELMVEMLKQLAEWFPDRKFMISGDSAYGGRSVLQHLPSNMDLISHVHPKGAMYEPAPPRTADQLGAKRKKGARLPGMQEWAADQSQRWKTLCFDQFGLHAVLQVKVRRALYYKAGKDRLLIIVLVRDKEGKRPDQMFYCTNLSLTDRQILSCYACRWSQEVTHYNCKQYLGFAHPANRKEKAVRRTAPMSLILYGLTVKWFDEEGYKKLEYPDRPWYPQKCAPSFADMLTTLRKETWRTNYGHLLESGSMSEKDFEELVFFLSLAG